MVCYLMHALEGSRDWRIFRSRFPQSNGSNRMIIPMHIKMPADELLGSASNPFTVWGKRKGHE